MAYLNLRWRYEEARIPRHDRAGFDVIRTKGIHHVLRHQDGRCTVVPVHAGETIGPGLLTKILRDTEVEAKDLE
jgi:predicted RNA binding protein YcfA (HicA-like mRNA interferase family)